MLTCPCNVYLLTPHFYIVKLGFTKGIHYFLIFALKHILWILVRTVSLRRFLRVPTINVLSKNKKNITFFHLKILIFTALKTRSVLHGHDFVMQRYCSRCFPCFKPCSVEHIYGIFDQDWQRTIKALIRLCLIQCLVHALR